MSKSKGEFLTVSLLEEKGYNPLAYRFFCLGSHYRKSLVFTYENLDNAVIAYDKLVARIASLDKSKTAEREEELVAALQKKFTDALDNDLNTSLAVTALYDVLKAKISDSAKLALVADFDKVLSVGLMEAAEVLRQKKAEEKPEETAGDPRILAAIAARAEAKRQKNYAEADRIRQELAAEGIVLIDTPQGTTYKIQ